MEKEVIQWTAGLKTVGMLIKLVIKKNVTLPYALGHYEYV